MAVICNIIRCAYLRCQSSDQLPIGGQGIWLDLGQPRLGHFLQQYFI